MFDRDPACPADGESFTVYMQCYDFDLTAVRVYFFDGSVSRWINAAYSHDRGVYDVWKAVLPCTDPSATVYYYFEVTDGSETDYLGPGGMSSSAPGTGWEINHGTLSHAPLGATLLSDGDAVFKVWGAGASSASVAGVFNSWSSSADSMNKSGDYFTARVESVNLEDKYKYVFDDTTWKPDARARRVDPSNDWNSYVLDARTYHWGDQDFEVPDFEDMIIYQLHVGTFCGRNDGTSFGYDPATYRSVVDTHLDHLVDLGINVVQLMPITEHPGDWSGGYNPVSQFSPEWKLGTPDDLKYMIDQLHQAGIAVTLDVVWNHFAGNDNYLWSYTGSGSSRQIYFDGDGVTGHFDTQWGPQADFDRNEVEDFFVHSGLYWLDEFHLDGFRFDGTDFMHEPNGQSSGWAVMSRFNDEMDNRAVDKIAIAEQLPDNYYFTRPTSQSGAGFDSQYHDRHKYAMRNAIFAAAGGTGSADITELRRTIMGDLNDGHNIIAEGQSTTQLAKYFELHDEVWAQSGGQRMVKTIDTTSPHDDEYARGRTLYGHALDMFSPGIPIFFMGSEFLEDTDFEADSANRIDWSKAATYSDYLLAFKDMIRIRKENPGFRANAGVEINRVDESKDILTMHRWDLSGNNLMVVASLANENQYNYRIGLPAAGNWHEIYNTQASVYGGNGVGNSGMIVSSSGSYDGYSYYADITIPKMSVSVFRLETCQNDGQCHDGVGCTDNACVQGRCKFTPNDAYCPDDGFYCNGTESCDPNLDCVSSYDVCEGMGCDEDNDVCYDDGSSETFILFEDCFSGPNQTPAPDSTAACLSSCLGQFDFDLDGDVDLMDYATYQIVLDTEIVGYQSDAAGWLAQFGTTEGYAFDSYFPGIASYSWLGSSTEVLALDTMNLTVTETGGNSAFMDNSGSAYISDALIMNGDISRWVFSQPIYGLYTYFASLADDNIASMTLYSGDTPMGTFSRDNGGTASDASGIGFTSNVGITRIDFSYTGTDSRVLVGAAVAVDGGETNLGTVYIPGYPGPSGANVLKDFAIATSPPSKIAASPAED